MVQLRQLKNRSLAVAAQAAIMVSPAARSVRAVSAALDGSGDRDAASGETRTYMVMLLVGAPVLIDARLSRNFLEQAQRLGGEMAHALVTLTRTPGAAAHEAARLDDAVQGLRTASAPLLQRLSPAERSAAEGGDGQPGGPHS